MDNKNKIDYLFNKLDYRLDENDPNIQEEYFRILDKIIDASLFIRYDDISLKKEFSSLNQLDEIVLYTFNTMDNKEKTLSSLTSKVAFATGSWSDKDYCNKIYDSFNNLYDLYLKTNNTLSHDWTTEFYNEILNRQQDNFMKVEKPKIIKRITSYFPLTDKKRKSMEISAKLKKANMLLSERDFINLNISENELHKKLEELHLYLNKVKPFCNSNGIDDKDFKILDNLFLNGILSFDKIKDIFPQYESSELKIILNKYSKLLLPYIDNIRVSEDELDFNTVDFNYNHIKITNNKRYYKNLQMLLRFMTEEEVDYVLNNFSNLEDIFKLLSLVNLLPEFNIEDFKAILFNYDKIINNLISNEKISSEYKFDYVLNNFYEVIKLSRAYNSADKYVRSIFDEDMISKILTEKQTSRIPKEYAEVYINMLINHDTTIPPIAGEVCGYKFESGNNYDLDRLMIGKNCVGSCLGPRGVGKEAYNAALTSNKADVVTFTKEDKFVGRTLLFRRGNCIIMAPIQGQKGLNKTLYSKEVLDYIGNKLKETSKDNGDNIDYIFLTYDNMKLLKDYDIIKSKIFVEGLPHCDLGEESYLIVGNDTLDFDDKINKIYQKKRQNVVCKSEDYEKDILRLRALEILMENDEKNKANLKGNFLNMGDFKKVYIGQDFYIGLTHGKNIDKVILNTNDLRQNDEINEVIGKLVFDIITSSNSKYESSNNIKN